MSHYPPPAVFWLRSWLLQASLLALLIPLVLQLASVLLRLRPFDLRLAWKPILCWLWLPILLGTGFVLWFVHKYPLDDGGATVGLIALVIVSLAAMAICFPAVAQVYRLSQGLAAPRGFTGLAGLLLSLTVVVSLVSAFNWSRASEYALGRRQGHAASLSQMNAQLASLGIPFPQVGVINAAAAYKAPAPPDASRLANAWVLLSDYNTTYLFTGSREQLIQTIKEELAKAGYSVYADSQPRLPVSSLMAYKEGVLVHYSITDKAVLIQLYQTYARETRDYYINDRGYEALP